MLKINITTILLVEGAVLEIDKTVDLKVVDTGIGKVNVVAPVEVKGVLKNIGDRIIFLVGRIKTKIEMPCDRCTKPVNITLEFDLDEKFSGKQIGNQEDNDFRGFEGHMIDLEPVIVDGIKLNIPMKVLCDPQCKGLCTNCGSNLNEKDCGCDITDIDPRLAGLKDLFSKK